MRIEKLIISKGYPSYPPPNKEQFQKKRRPEGVDQIIGNLSKRALEIAEPMSLAQGRKQ